MHSLNPCLVAVCLLAFTSISHAEEWTPPENPDPRVILSEARDDAQAKRYEVALAKHVWFHENALSLSQGMGGVRLSFALSYWKRLGSEYPPAMDKLRSIRDALEAKAENGEDIDRGFHDLAAINRTLGEESRTTEAFESLESLNPQAAKKAFHFVQSALIKDKAYKLYVKFVDPKMDFLRMKHLYELNLQMAEDPKFGASIAEHGTKTFRNGSATLVAILVVNDRKPEAEEIAALAKKELDDAQFHKELDAALSGTVPKPWP
jgi:hypothetical protein